MMSKENDKKYKRMTDEEVKKLAVDMHKGIVFTSLQIKDPKDIGIVFTPLMFMKKEDLDEMIEHPPGFIYEYMSKASQMYVNGMPIFLSFKVISSEDAKRVLDYYFMISKAMGEL